VDPDRSLVDAAAAGDRDAFGALVSRYQSRIVNLARTLTSEAAEADDLAQETFVRAYKSIRRFRGDSAFRTWLYRVAVNVIHSYLASRSKRWRWFGGTGDERDAEMAKVPESRGGRAIEDAVVRRDLIDRALASLPPDMRIAVTLRDMHGLEYAEIAAALKIPIGTVESRIFRARQRLRPLLAPLVGAGGAGRAGGAGGL
jgi:RNA polymerase sigma-70 factor (ECF subfamily)